MSESRQPKIYTLEEARELVPRLRPVLNEIRELRREIAAHTDTLGRIAPEMRNNGHAPEVARLEGRISNCTDEIRALLQQLDDLDIEVRDLDIGLVDFMTRREGRVVYLCWAADEPTIAYWHELDSGFRGRRPLDE